MRVIHITRRRMALLSLALGMVIGSALLLAGCFGGEEDGDHHRRHTRGAGGLSGGAGLAGGAAAH